MRTHVAPTDSVESPRIDKLVERERERYHTVLAGLDVRFGRSSRRERKPGYHDGKSLSTDVERQDLERVRDEHGCVRNVVEEIKKENEWKRC